MFISRCLNLICVNLLNNMCATSLVKAAYPTGASWSTLVVRVRVLVFYVVGSVYLIVYFIAMALSIS